jgi:L-fucono-1,5-lactonase
MIVDAHQHFWKIDRGDYFWMDDSVSQIRRDILPPVLKPLVERCGVSASIAVQAASTVAETEFLLSLAASTPLVRGVVGWVDLESSHAATVMKKLAGNPFFKGIRPMLQDIEETDWVLRSDVIGNLAIASELGLTLDALVQPRHLDVLAELAAALPDLKIVVDHCAKPVIRDGKDAGEGWRRGMALLAEHKQIFCKLSGLANEYGTGWSEQNLRPVLNHVLLTFGPKRLMWGSDWPVLELAGTYEDWFACAQGLTSELAEKDRAQIFGETAADFYRL